MEWFSCQRKSLGQEAAVSHREKVWHRLQANRMLLSRALAPSSQAKFYREEPGPRGKQQEKELAGFFFPGQKGQAPHTGPGDTAVSVHTAGRVWASLLH